MLGKSFVIIILIAFSIVPILATSVGVDKSSYLQGDNIIFSGTVNPVEPGQFASVQILNPPKSDFAQIDTFVPNSDGTFSKTYVADGPKWNLEGVYTIKLFYGGESFETTFEFSLVEPEPTPTPEPTPAPEPTPTPEPTPAPEPTSVEVQKPKTHIPGFPELDKSPQYYIDRYNNEQSYKDWFDSQFPGREISDVVGYDQTHIPGFPELDKSPQYYIDRYNNEQSYKDWFDSQFPNKSIYNVLAFPDPVEIPDWIKDIAEWWSTGEIDDDTFVSGIEFMIENNIIIIPNLPESEIAEDNSVPSWVRNNANWWALDRISEEEFVNAIKFLVEKGIIIV